MPYKTTFDDGKSTISLRYLFPNMVRSFNVLMSCQTPALHIQLTVSANVCSVIMYPFFIKIHTKITVLPKNNMINHLMLMHEIQFK